MELIADTIRQGVIEGTFPPGSQLGEVQLANRLQVSRGPLREALQRLVQEGLLVSRPHRGVFVIELDDAGIADVYLARRAVERAAAGVVARRHGPEVLDELAEIVEWMAAAVTRERWAQVVDLDRAFHRALVDGAGSPRLSRMYSTLQAETAVCLGALRPSYPVRQEIVTEHRQLLDALAGADETVVVAAVDRHLDSAVTALTGARSASDRSQPA